MLDVSNVGGKPLTVRWPDIRKSQGMGEASKAREEEATEANNLVRLITPTEEGYWAALIKA